MFCIQKLYKSKLHDNECTKNVQIVQNLYKVQTKNGLKLEMHVFCTYKTLYKLYKTYTTSYLKWPLYVFCRYKQCTYKMYTNVN